MKKTGAVDGYDLLVLAGLVGLGVAAGLAWGWVAVVAYGSTVALIVGMVGAVSEGRGV